MKSKTFFGAVYLLLLLGAFSFLFAKYESGSYDAASSVLYGKNGSNIVAIQVDENGTVVTSGGAGGGNYTDFVTNETANISWGYTFNATQLQVGGVNVTTTETDPVWTAAAT